MKLSYIFLPLFFLLVSCEELDMQKPEKLTPKDFTLVNIRNEYEMDLPTYMSKTLTLNDEASLQYQNTLRETYTIVIDESKETFIDFAYENEYMDEEDRVLDVYTDLQVENMLGNATKVISKKAPVESIINGLHAQTVELAVEVDDVDDPIAYYFTFIESDAKLYMLMSWTLNSRYTKYQPTFKQIANSFYSVEG